jgi:hypothetical protein
MSIAKLTGGARSPDGEDKPWMPAFTAKEAAKLGVDRDLYPTLLIWARMVVEYHQVLGTSRHLWEGNSNHNDQFVGQYVEDGEQELAIRLEAEADPELDDMQQSIESVKENVDALSQPDRPLSAPETGFKFSVRAAVEAVNEHDAKIEQDTKNGRNYHQRAHPVLRGVGRGSPWVEAVGFLAFVTYYLDVPLLQPWTDWFSSTFAMAIVSIVILGQTWLVNHAAIAHNWGREAAGEDNRHEAERCRSNRARYLLGTAVVAVAITSGMVLRGMASLGDASFGTAAVMVFLAIVCGLLMPTLAYLGTALDGSRISRERDALATALDDDLDDYLAGIADSTRIAHGVAEQRDRLKTKTFPDICNTVQETVNQVHTPYNTARLMIGGLTSEPPVRPSRQIRREEDGSFVGEISTGVPGARTVNLLPLIDRVSRLDALDDQLAEVQQLLDNLPSHPWAISRTA